MLGFALMRAAWRGHPIAQVGEGGDLRGQSCAVFRWQSGKRRQRTKAALGGVAGREGGR